MTTRRFACLLTALAAPILAGCGLAPGHASSGVSLLVTRDFGQRVLGSLSESRVPKSQTLIEMLERRFRVITGGAGRTVISVDGVRGDWLAYVNGVQQQARSHVHDGDRIWWELHDPAAAATPSVVGSFPEPFLDGIGGRRLPTVLECAPHVTAACTRAAGKLSSLGVPVSNQAPGTGSGTDSLAVAVGTWAELRSTIAAVLLTKGPRASGVYATFSHGGSALELLDSGGRVTRRLNGSAGLIAAVSQGSAAPTWLIMGTDPAGVSAAASAFTASRLDRHFALAVQGHTDFPVPSADAQ